MSESLNFNNSNLDHQSDLTVANAAIDRQAENQAEWSPESERSAISLGEIAPQSDAEAAIQLNLARDEVQKLTDEPANADLAQIGKLLTTVQRNGGDSELTKKLLELAKQKRSDAENLSSSTTKTVSSARSKGVLGSLAAGFGSLFGRRHKSTPELEIPGASETIGQEKEISSSSENPVGAPETDEIVDVEDDEQLGNLLDEAERTLHGTTLNLMNYREQFHPENDEFVNTGWQTRAHMEGTLRWRQEAFQAVQDWYNQQGKTESDYGPRTRDVLARWDEKERELKQLIAAYNEAISQAYAKQRAAAEAFVSTPNVEQTSDNNQEVSLGQDQTAQATNAHESIEFSQESIDDYQNSEPTLAQTTTPEQMTTVGEKHTEASDTNDSATQETTENVKSDEKQPQVKPDQSENEVMPQAVKAPQEEVESDSLELDMTEAFRRDLAAAAKDLDRHRQILAQADRLNLYTLKIRRRDAARARDELAASGVYMNEIDGQFRQQLEEQLKQFVAQYSEVISGYTQKINELDPDFARRQAAESERKQAREKFTANLQDKLRSGKDEIEHYQHLVNSSELDTDQIESETTTIKSRLKELNQLSDEVRQQGIDANGDKEAVDTLIGEYQNLADQFERRRDPVKRRERLQREIDVAKNDIKRLTRFLDGVRSGEDFRLVDVSRWRKEADLKMHDLLDLAHQADNYEGAESALAQQLHHQYGQLLELHDQCQSLVKAELRSAQDKIAKAEDELRRHQRALDDTKRVELSHIGSNMQSLQDGYRQLSLLADKIRDVDDSLSARLDSVLNGYNEVYKGYAYRRLESQLAADAARLSGGYSGAGTRRRRY